MGDLMRKYGSLFTHYFQKEINENYYVTSIDRVGVVTNEHNTGIFLRFNIVEIDTELKEIVQIHHIEETYDKCMLIVREMKINKITKNGTTDTNDT